MELIQVSLNQLITSLQEHDLDPHAMAVKYLVQSVAEEVDRICDLLVEKLRNLEVETQKQGPGRERILGISIREKQNGKGS